jgi:hypothetical protein
VTDRETGVAGAQTVDPGPTERSTREGLRPASLPATDSNGATDCPAENSC